MLIGCPILGALIIFSCDRRDCALLETTFDILRLDAAAWHDVSVYLTEQLTVDRIVIAAAIFVGWLALQAVLYIVVPAKQVQGERTPAGRVPMYRINGLRTWVVTHVLFAAAVAVWGECVGTAALRYQLPLFAMGNVYGFAVSALLVLRAHWQSGRSSTVGSSQPAHNERHPDRVLSGSIAYDFLMGCDLHPRLGADFDLKIYHNSHVGMTAWSLLNASFALSQYYSQGYVSWGMLATNVLQLVYVLDFFVKESWYLATIDIALEHFGWYLAWGITTWLPVTYTLQARVLASIAVPSVLSESGLFAAFSVALGLAGYIVFRSANNCRTNFRASKGAALVWGRPARYVTAHYETADGRKHSSLLLASGFWGWARHFNYTGDLVLSLAYSLPCGFTHLLPYFYPIYMVILLLHRIARDDDKCRAKYGQYWDEYCRMVPAKLIPGIY